jgi:hypothetical protein
VESEFTSQNVFLGRVEAPVTVRDAVCGILWADMHGHVLTCLQQNTPPPANEG